MSVILLSTNHYKTAYNKACSFKNQTIVDVNYCYTFSQLSESTLKQMFKDWFTLNYLSYCGRYKKEMNEDVLLGMYKTINRWDYNPTNENCTTIQELKLLSCIRYQIDEEYCFAYMESETIEKYKDSLNFLDEVINDLQMRIISTLSEYKVAKWCID